MRYLKNVEHVQIIACGTSYHSGMVARYWLEELAGVSCNIEIASEFRYRKSFVPKNCIIGDYFTIGRNSRYFSCVAFSERTWLSR